jgi:hypothetical protein
MSFSLNSGRFSAALFLFLLAASSGCDMRGCICHEALTVDRSVKEIGKEETRLILGNKQTGEAAEINMKVPATMNASLCVC